MVPLIVCLKQSPSYTLLCLEKQLTAVNVYLTAVRVFLRLTEGGNLDYIKVVYIIPLTGSIGFLRMSNDEQEKRDVAEFLLSEAQLDKEGLTLLERFFRVLDDERFRGMKPGQQLLYLQLLRWQQGRNREMLEASRSQMSEWTGLAWDTVKKYLPALIKARLVTTVREATPTYSAAYEVHWLPPRPASASTPSPLAAATYVDQLDRYDLQEFHRLELLLTMPERRRMQGDIGEELHQLGIPWNYDLIKKLVIWRFLTKSPYRRTLAKKHPEWFGPVQQSI